jgi:hypothetical protein
MNCRTNWLILVSLWGTRLTLLLRLSPSGRLLNCLMILMSTWFVLTLLLCFTALELNLLQPLTLTTIFTPVRRWAFRPSLWCFTPAFKPLFLKSLGARIWLVMMTRVSSFLVSRRTLNGIVTIMASCPV